MLSTIPNFTPAEIYRLRFRLGLTQKEAAESIGYRQPVWSRWELGTLVPSERARLSLARMKEQLSRKPKAE